MTPRMRKLEAENTHLREMLEKAMATYRDQIYEIVDLRTKMKMIEQAMGIERGENGE